MAARQVTTRTEVCKVCSNPFTCGKRGRRGAFCSDACRRMGRLPQVVCHTCAKTFQSLTPNQRFCSQACNQRNRRAQTAVTDVTCRLCGTNFSRLSHLPQQVYCSANCRERVRRKKRSAYLRTAQRLRKYRMSENGMEQVCPVTVFERDDWTCYLCGQKVNRVAERWADDEPTIDHVVPLSKGGPHTYVNVRCACRSCNRAKNNRELVAG